MVKLYICKKERKKEDISANKQYDQINNNNNNNKMSEEKISMHVRSQRKNAANTCNQIYAEL